MTSLAYKLPRLYNLLLRMVHGKNLSIRNKKIAKIIGKNNKVLDLACGTCILYDYLDKSCEYEGWDLNEKFINSRKDLNLKVKSVFDYKDYPKVDVIVISDLLHHVVPRHEELINKVRRKARKVIIVEPHVNHTIGSESNSKLKQFFYRLWDKTFGDDDGINDYKDRKGWFTKKEEVRDFFMKFKPEKIEELGLDYLVVL